MHSIYRPRRHVKIEVLLEYCAKTSPHILIVRLARNNTLVGVNMNKNETLIPVVNLPSNHAMTLISGSKLVTFVSASRLRVFDHDGVPMVASVDHPLVSICTDGNELNILFLVPLNMSIEEVIPLTTDGKFKGVQIFVPPPVNIYLYSLLFPPEIRRSGLMFPMWAVAEGIPDSVKTVLLLLTIITYKRVL